MQYGRITLALSASLFVFSGAFAQERDDRDAPPPVERVEGEGNVAFRLQLEDEAEGGYAVNPAGDEIAVGIDEWVLFFDPATGGRFRSWRTGRGHVNGLTWTPDGTRLVAGTRTGIFCWNIESEMQVWRAQGHVNPKAKQPEHEEGASDGVAISPDGKTVVSIEDAHTTLRLIDGATGKVQRHVEHGIKDPSHILASPDGTHFLVWSDWSKGGVVCFRWSDFAQVWRHDALAMEPAAAFTKDGTIAALGVSGGGSGDVLLVETATGSKVESFGPNGDFDIGGVDFTADGTGVVAAGGGKGLNPIYVWRRGVKNQRPGQIHRNHTAHWLKVFGDRVWVGSAKDDQIIVFKLP